MGTIVDFNRKKVFSLEEARGLLPLIKRITEESNNKVKKMLSVLDAVRDRDPNKAKDLEAQVSRFVEDWQTKVSKLGAEGKGLWLVDFDCGTGYLCWKFPEDKLEHFHSYTDGFQARVKIDALDKQHLL